MSGRDLDSSGRSRLGSLSRLDIEQDSEDSSLRSVDHLRF